MPVKCSRSVYRSILREAAKVKVLPVRKKICYNCRELFDLYRAEKDPLSIQRLRDNGAAAVRVMVWLNQLPEVLLLRESLCHGNTL